MECRFCLNAFVGKKGQKFCSSVCYHSNGHSFETRKKLSRAHSGKSRSPIDEETKKKISLANAGRSPWNKGKVLDAALYASRSGKNHHFYVSERTEYERELKTRKRWRAVLHLVFRRIGTVTEDVVDERVGYSAKQLKERLESLFDSTMSWENYGKWEIDHVKNVSEFHVGTHASIVNALSNLRPLMKKENQCRKKFFTKKRKSS